MYRLAILFYLLFMGKAYAYLDPGSASLILQGILAALVGGIATIGIYWNKFKFFVLNIFKSQKKTNK